MRDKHLQWLEKYRICRDYRSSLIGDIDLDEWFIVSIESDEILEKGFSTYQAAEIRAQERYLTDMIEAMLK